jgi:hypothetical protein
VPAGELVAAFENAPRIDAKRFRRDVDRFVDQRPEPRG